MAHFEDLSEYSYLSSHGQTLRVVNVGWLGEGHTFPTGETPESFRSALAELCKEHGLHFCAGHHVCDFCPGASWQDRYYHDMGNGEVWVRDATNLWYAAPRQILHYVEVHGYRPPDGFIETVMNPSGIGTRDLGKEHAVPLRLEEPNRLRGRPVVAQDPATDAEIDAIIRKLAPDVPLTRRWWRRFF